MSLSNDHISRNKRKLLIILGAFSLGVVFVASSSVVLNGIQSSRLPNIDVVADNSARTQAVPTEVTSAKTDPVKTDEDNIVPEKTKETSESAEVELSDEEPVEAQTDQLNAAGVTGTNVIRDESGTNETDTPAMDENALETPFANEGYKPLREQSGLKTQADETPKIKTSNSAEETSDLNSSAPKRLHPVTSETRPETARLEPEPQVYDGDKTPKTQSEPD